MIVVSMNRNGFDAISPVDSPDGDDALVRRFIENQDEAAFETLIRRHLPTIRRILGAIDRLAVEDREDLLQEVLIRVHGSLKRFRFQAAITTWLYRLVHNTAKDYLRSRFRAVRRDIRYTVHEAQRAPDPEEMALDEIRTDDLRSLFFRLEETDRQLLLLREREELTMEEIGMILEVPLGTVKSRLNRARKRARKFYEEAIR